MSEKVMPTRVTPYQYEPADQDENIANKQRLIQIMQVLIQAPISELEQALKTATM